MRLVDRPVKRPMRCAAIPFIGQSHQQVRWVDTGCEMEGGFDNHVYLSDAAVRAAMDCLHWPAPERFRELQATLDALNEENRALYEEIGKLRRFREAVHVMRDEGYQSARKPGRPPKEVAT